MSKKPHRKAVPETKSRPDGKLALPSGREAVLRVLLVLFAFFCGAALMIIELCANRVLAPWFGNSLYTWTGLIGIILVAMSFGYYFGGWLADRRPEFAVLCHLVLASAFFTLLIPFIQGAIDETFSQADLVWGPVLSSVILFTLPGCLLGSVPPFAVRLTSLLYRDRRIGTSAGSIGMFSTLGSVLGTFAAGFFLIPQMGVRTIFFLMAILLACLSLSGYALFPFWKKKGKAFLPAAVFLIALSAGFSLYGSPLPPEVLFDRTTFYHRVRVVEEKLPGGDAERTLMLDTTVEGARYRTSPEIPIPYQRYWELIRVFRPDLKAAAFLGAGAYTMPIALSRAFPAARVDVVEIDPQVVEVGRRFFGLDEHPRITPVVADARRFLAVNRENYDFIFGDAYNGLRYVPAHLVTAEFFGLVRKRLGVRGVYMMNLISAVKGEQARLFQAVHATLGQAFRHIYVFPLYPGDLEMVQNVILAASDRELALKIDPGSGGPDPLRLERLLASYVPPDRYLAPPGAPLTDNFNPVEYIVARGLR